MSSRREEKDRLRQERLKSEKSAARGEHRRLLLGYIVAGLIVAAVIAGLVVVIAGGGGSSSDPSPGDFPENAHIQPLAGSVNDYTPDEREGTTPPAVQIGSLTEAAEAANCELMLELKDEGNTHITPKDPEPDYKTNPPTSGDHINPQLQQADGAYSDLPDPKYTVHSLEHGRIGIQYSPDLPEEDQLAIKGVFDQSPEGILLFPNPEMPYDVAATAWTNLLGCDSYEGAATLDALRAFRETFRGFGPEDVPVYLQG